MVQQKIRHVRCGFHSSPHPRRSLGVKTERLCGEPSWSVHSDCVSVGVSRDGGQLGPVEFDLGGRLVHPMHVAPWAGAKEAAALPPILRALRGDFFCMPFGGNETPWRGEYHPIHGETANAPWQYSATEAVGRWACLRASMHTTTRPAQVDKLIALRAGHRAVYSRHVITGGRGPMCFGHHAMLSCGSDEIRLSAAPFARGQVFPGNFEDPSRGGYSSLKAGALFRSLKRVPLAAGGFADLSRYPAREGFEDLVMISSKPATEFAWTAAVFAKAGYVWFSLRDPRVLASTVLWHSNGGRHYPPWNGRHRGVLGVEDVTANFHFGLAESATPSPVSKAGIPTCVQLGKEAPLVVSSIMGVAPLPKGFETIAMIGRVDGGIELRSPEKKTVRVELDTGFLYGEEEL